jgi:protocatechuate 3,4-dioxygenase beta subunit
MTANKDEISLDRRRALGLLVGSASVAAVLVGCGGSSGSSSSTNLTDDSDDSTSAGTDTGLADSTDCPSKIPEETEGPYPTASSNVMVRQDITESETGVPLEVQLKIVNINDNCSAVTSAEVHIWHCDKDGNYSGYETANSNTTYLRGSQYTGSDGIATFRTIYPGWYTGRITHIHFQVNVNGTEKATSQLAFPQDVTQDVYNSSLYSDKGQNTSVTSFSRDNVFSDGTSLQMLDISGSVDEGYVGTLTVGISL